MYEQHRFGRVAMLLVLLIALVPFEAAAAQDLGLNSVPAPSLAASSGDPESPAGWRATMSARQIDAEAVSLKYLYNEFAVTMGHAGVAGNDYAFRTKRVEEDQESNIHTHVQQLYRGVRVFGGEAIVHLDRDGQSPSITDDLLRDVQVNTKPTLRAAEAVKIAIAHYGCESCLTAKPKTDLWVMRPVS